MSEETVAQGSYMLWINWSDHIVSFREVEGGDYEQLEFSSNEERFSYVFNHCSAGFRIQ